MALVFVYMYFYIFQMGFFCSIVQGAGKTDTNRFSLFMCGGLNLDDKSSVACSNLDSPLSPNAQVNMFMIQLL